MGLSLNLSQIRLFFNQKIETFYITGSSVPPFVELGPLCKSKMKGVCQCPRHPIQGFLVWYSDKISKLLEKNYNQISEVIHAAKSEGRCNHITLTSGFTAEDDKGLNRYINIIKTIILLRNIDVWRLSYN